jgi:tetratricopeptide (TPR) repeat protein
MGRNFVLGPGGSLLTHWWVFVPATVAVILFGVAWNLLGDGLNDVLDPTSHYSFRPRGFRRSEAMDDSVPLPAGINPGVAQLASPQPLPGEGAKRPVSGSPLDAPAPAGADPVLQTARDRLSQGDLEGALQAYGHLIRRGRRLDEILPDLAQLVKKHPRDPLAWQTLGDALVRAGDTAHAAQSYEQARKLMQ